jgi:trehalose utilization protein
MRNTLQNFYNRRRIGMNKIRVTVWSEGIDPNLEPKAVALYPNDINTYIASFLEGSHEFEVKVRSLSQPENGLSQEIIDNTDVLIWWSHLYDDEVDDNVVERVVNAVLNGMGFLILHASMGSKPAKRLLGESSNVGKYREIGEKERVWVVNRSHPVVEGMEKEYFEILKSEMYGEPYGMPTPDDTIFISWFEGGEVLRSGVSWHKGSGRIFFFAPGHEEFPVYYNKEVQKVITNIVRWLKPVKGPEIVFRGEIGSIEPLTTTK